MIRWFSIGTGGKRSRGIPQVPDHFADEEMKEAFDLPDWYPLANAPEDEIEAWLSAEVLPVDAMRLALPWLTEPYQFRAWVDGLRTARSEAERGVRIIDALPGLAAIPLPPRRLEGRKHQ